MNSSTLKGEENNRVGNDCKARGKDHTALISFSTFESVEYSGSSRMTYWTPPIGARNRGTASAGRTIETGRIMKYNLCKRKIRKQI